MQEKNRKRPVWIFGAALFLVAVVLALSILSTHTYNSVVHHETFSGPDLFAPAHTGETGVSVSAAPRGSTKYQERHERDNEIINESIETFTGFIDAKDPYTNGHSKRVAIYTRRIAKEFGYDGEELDRIYYVALLHDCGKIGVPDSILGKPERLTDAEYEMRFFHA